MVRTGKRFLSSLLSSQNGPELYRVVLVYQPTIAKELEKRPVLEGKDRIPPCGPDQEPGPRE